jgi:hypothetical protein
MPRVGSKQSIVRTPPATQRAMVTFCWFPPDSRLTSAAARVSIWSCSIAALTLPFSRPSGIGPQVRMDAENGSAMFSRTERCISRASARSAGT